MVNPRDDEALKRIINQPARGIGDTTLLKLQAAARANQTSMWEQIGQEHLAEFGLKPTAQNKLREFMEMINDTASRQYDIDAYDFALEAATHSGYLSELQNDLSSEGKTRLENVGELFNSIKEFTKTEEGNDLPTVHAFLSNVALITELEETDDRMESRVSLMTVHAAKGLEFKYVYMVGLEENLFPSKLSLGSQRELEEERRLFYVGLTRAKVGLSLSYAQTRYRWGTLTGNSSSRFLKEIDARWLNKPIQDEAIPMDLERELTGAKKLFQRSVNTSSSRPLPPPRPANPNFVAAQPEQFAAGQKIEHERFGIGRIVSLDNSHPAERKAVVDFGAQGTKTLLLKYAKMKILS